MMSGRLLSTLLALGVMACGARSSLDVPSSSADAGVSCAPNVLATTTLSLVPADISVDAEAVIGPYVVNDYVYIVQLSDGATEPNAASPDHIATVERVPIAGGALTPVAAFGVRADRGGAVQLAFDANYMYWVGDAVIGAGPGESQGTVERARHDGSERAVVLGGLVLPAGVALDEGKLYFNNFRHYVRMNVDGTALETVDDQDTLSFVPGASDVVGGYSYVLGGAGVERVSNSGGTLAPVSMIVASNAPFETTAFGISQSDSFGFAMIVQIDPGKQDSGTSGADWIGVGSISRWPSSGGAATTIASGFAARFATWVRSAIDGAYVYFSAANEIMRVPVAGGTPESIGPAAGVGGIAFDQTRVYWTSRQGSVASIYTACK